MMNADFLVVLSGLLIVHAVEALAQVLNLKALGRPLPAGFETVYDREKYGRSQAYTAARLRFSLAVSTLSLAGLLAFWFAGGFAALDRWAAGRGLAPAPTGLLYVGVLFFGQDVLSLPAQLYSTFVIEARYGFNRTTPRTFVLDKVKAWALTVLIGGAFLWALLAFFHRFGPGAWPAAWGTAVVFRLLLQFVAPTWIMPLFNKFTPLPEGELRTSILDYARSVDFPLANVFVMDGSKRSSKTNAFFTGFGRNKRIALFDTLIQRHSVPELTAVMAHEIGHYKMGHVRKGLVLNVLHDGLLFFLLSLSLGRAPLFTAFGLPAPSVHAGLVIFGFLYAPVSFLLGVGLAAFSRKNEFEADAYSARTLPSALPMVQALRNLCAANLTNLTPHPLHVFLTYTHPPVPDRVAALQRAPSGPA